MNESIYEKLKEVARAKELITYGELNQELNLGLDFDKPEDRRKIGNWLDEINRHEYREGRPMLSAVVVQKERDGTYGDPGDGFYQLARELGIFQGDKRYIFWVSELNVVHNYWSSH